MTKFKIGFIGFGNLAQSIWAGSKDFMLLESEGIYCYKPSRDNLPNEINYLPLSELLQEVDIVILALKPQQLSLISDDLKRTNWENRCLISLLAGTPSTAFKTLMPSLKHFIRVMPNTCAKIAESMTVISHLNKCDAAYISFVQELFNRVGKTLIIDESQMNFCTGLAGSGPAFIYELARKLQHLAIKEGFNEADAELLVDQLFKGSAAMMGREPLDQMIKAISSPNGTTVRGLETLAENGVGQGLQQVVLAAKLRADELSKQ